MFSRTLVWRTAVLQGNFSGEPLFSNIRAVMNSSLPKMFEIALHPSFEFCTNTDAHGLTTALTWLDGEAHVIVPRVKRL